jgi:hypothetical protein
VYITILVKYVRNRSYIILNFSDSVFIFAGTNLFWVSAVGMVTDYELDDRGDGLQVPVGSRIFYSPRLTDRSWGPSSLLSDEYQGLFPREESDKGMKLTTHLQPVPRSRKRGSIHPLPHKSSWRSAYLSTRTILPFI